VECFTRLHYSDLSTLNSEHIDSVSGNINIKQCKVHKAVVILLIDYVPDILKKYNYELPKISGYRFNERVKELEKKINLNQKVEVVRKKGNIRVPEISINGQ
jgi:hypothetical protein